MVFQLIYYRPMRKLSLLFGLLVTIGLSGCVFHLPNSDREASRVEQEAEEMAAEAERSAARESRRIEAEQAAAKLAACQQIAALVFTPDSTFSSTTDPLARVGAFIDASVVATSTYGLRDFGEIFQGHANDLLLLKQFMDSQDPGAYGFGETVYLEIYATQGHFYAWCWPEEE